MRGPFGGLAVPALGASACVGVLCLIWLPFLPNGAGLLGVDYGFWLPGLLAGDFWHAHAPWAAMPWFSPALCAGAPFHADPQGAYLSLTQWLTFAVSPLVAVQASFVIYAMLGFAGTYVLARRSFGSSRPASFLAAALFTLNGMYSARMMVGHLSFAPFMLVPAMAACALGQVSDWRAQALRCLGFGLLFTIMLQGGMAVLVLPAFLSLAMLAVMQAQARRGSLAAAAGRMVAGGSLGLMICAGKLAAAIGLLGNVPRDMYPLPGFRNVAVAGWMACRSLFLWPASGMTHALANAAVSLELHEFDYRVGPVPLLLLGAAAWLGWTRRQGAATLRTRLLWEALAVLLLLPLALNTYGAAWTAFLKHLPILRSSSNLVRFFAAYIVPACIGGGLALDRTVTAGPRAWTMALGGAALTALCLLAGDRGFYGQAGIGVYDPAPVQASWRFLAAGEAVPAIRTLAVPLDKSGQPDMSIGRGNLLTEGASPLFCYDPLFGYHLEQFRQGSLHAGPVTDVTVVGGRKELNLKNPACYVFPAANGCTPGDNFTVAGRADAAAFAGYRPFAFAKPWWADAADWLGIVSTVTCVLAALAIGTQLIRWRHAAR